MDYDPEHGLSYWIFPEGKIEQCPRHRHREIAELYLDKIYPSYTQAIMAFLNAGAVHIVAGNHLNVTYTNPLQRALQSLKKLVRTEITKGKKVRYTNLRAYKDDVPPAGWSCRDERYLDSIKNVKNWEKALNPPSPLNRQIENRSQI